MPSIPSIPQQPPFVHSTPTLCPGVAHSHKPSVNITKDRLAPQWVHYTFPSK
ncbi:hypothetical protein M405DRAFT_809484 [Rhizopogon salebrosus TDB-379]|nr:hypothetical protein M405DRAFT_809484 [Rhizopogon salebrosus TDB-379]